MGRPPVRGRVSLFFLAASCIVAVSCSAPRTGPLLFVTNEVGWGIVPDNPLVRQFRDIAGWTNQQMAQMANEVILMVAGIPIITKKAACS